MLNNFFNYSLYLALCFFIFAAQHAHATQNKEVNSLEKITEQQPVDPTDWTESLHRSVSNSVYQSANWFDSFFTDGETCREQPSTSARIRLGWRPKARDLSEFKARFRIKVKLPHFKNQMSLILSDEEDIEQSQLPLESINTQQSTEKEHFSAAIRYIHKNVNDRLTDSRIGISAGDIFIRARHKQKYSWDVRHGITIEPSIYYFLDDGTGARLLLEYNYQLDDFSQFRANYSIRGSESFSGIRWKHGFYKLRQMNSTTATILGLQIEGQRNGASGFEIDNYTLSYRYRFNAVKKWLFFEVEPFIEWPENENYTTTPGIALRVEGFFNKN